MTPEGISTPGGQGRFGDMLAGMAHQLEMASGDGERLRLLGNSIQDAAYLVRGWAGASGTLAPPVLETNTLICQFGPNPYTRMSQASQDIPNATWTAITFDQVSFQGTPSAVRWDSATPTRLYFNGRATDSFFMVYGSIWWDTNATGSRGVRTMGSSASGRFGAFLPTAAAVAPVIPFAHDWRTKTADEYAEIQVYQNSGGVLSLNAASVVNIIRVQ